VHGAECKAQEAVETERGSEERGERKKYGISLRSHPRLPIGSFLSFRIDVPNDIPNNLTIYGLGGWGSRFNHWMQQLLICAMDYSFM
jgi:hypothetical protein